MASTSAKATAIGGLPVPLAAIALVRPVRSCFLDPESRNFNRLHLISFHLARTRAYARLQGVRGQAVLAPRQVLDDPARGALSRLHPEGDRPDAGAGAAAGRMCRCYTSSTVA
jgi:hypothetical protein